MSYLMFAYDLYLFGEANMKQLRVTNCLQLLCRLLDQKVNETKSYIFSPPRNTKAEIRPQIFLFICWSSILLIILDCIWVCLLPKIADPELKTISMFWMR